MPKTVMDLALSRRAIILLGAGMNIFVPSSLAGQPADSTMSVLKTSGCGCCRKWIKRMQAVGFIVNARDVSAADLTKAKLDLGLRSELASCHTAQLGGYVIEGHVPAREIQRLIKEKPQAIGVAVPGMPTGSPGMEFGSSVHAYDVLLVRPDGRTEIFAHYPGK